MLQRTQNFRCRFVSLNLLVLVDGFDLCSSYVVFVVKNVDLRVTSSKRLTAYLIMYNGLRKYKSLSAATSLDLFIDFKSYKLCKERRRTLHLKFYLYFRSKMVYFLLLTSWM